MEMPLTQSAYDEVDHQSVCDEVDHHLIPYMQARGRTPAGRRQHQGGDSQSYGLTPMAADFTFMDCYRIFFA